jgi:FMN hydrolase / 5-amino-6-(5-phospho-D-ribitylamino)uracil phosphatase
LFDFGGTLDADGLRWSVRFHAAYAAGNGRVHADAFEEVFRASDRALLAWPGIETLGFRAMIEAQTATLAPLLVDGNAINWTAVADRVHSDAVAIADRNRPLLRALRREFRLGVVSNFTGNLVHCLSELDLFDPFDHITDSAVLGVSKPHPTAFLSTLEGLSVDPADAWIIGDNFEADIRPARSLGMRSCWLSPPERAVPADGLFDARIAHLTDLPEVLRACMV